MKCLFLIGFLFVSVQLSAQEAFVVTGDDLTTGFGTVNCSVGQLIVISDSTKIGSMRHGIQIPIELLRNPVGIEEYSEITAEAFPNPTYNHVKIIIPEKYQGPFSLMLLDIEGGILETHLMNSHEMMISLMHRSAGSYTIVIHKESKTVSSFSIIKQ
jgi:hypothetical protein